MERRVFRPLEMESTVPDRNMSIIPKRARPYGVIGGKVINAPEIDNSDAWASAGFLSSAEDLARFGQAMLTGELLAPRTLALLWTPMHTKDGSPTGYGMGWQLLSLSGREAYGHGGGHVGATADFWIVPEESLVMALMTNANSAGLPRLAEQFAELFLE